MQDRKILYIDETSDNLVVVDINGVEGMLVVDEDITSVVWQDGKYLYAIQGTFTSQEELLHICKSVKLMN